MGNDITARTTVRLILLASPLALVACAAGRDLQPAATLPKLTELQVGTAVTASASAGDPQPDHWWQVYQDPQLDRLIASALSDSPTITIAAARIAQADAELGGAKAATRLQVAGSAEATGEYFPRDYVYPQPYAGHVGSEGDLTATARLHLDFWGKYRNATAAAGARLEATQAEARDAGLLLQTAIVEAYLRLDAAYRLRDVAAADLAHRQATVDLLALRSKAGLASEIDTVEDREAVTVARGEIARLDGEISGRRNEIAALLGKGPGFGDGLQRPMLSFIADPAPASALPASLLGYRPDVIAERARVETAAKDIGVARAAFYPDIDLTAFAGLASLGIGNLIRASSGALGAGPALTLPIFDGDRLRSDLKGRNAAYDEAVADYDATIAKALQQVADGVDAVRAEGLRKAQSDAAVTYRAHVVELQKLRERQGLSNTLDRLSAETALLRAQGEATTAQARLSAAQLSLIRALGGVWTRRSI